MDCSWYVNTGDSIEFDKCVCPGKEKYIWPHPCHNCRDRNTGTAEPNLKEMAEAQGMNKQARVRREALDCRIDGLEITDHGHVEEYYRQVICVIEWLGDVLHNKIKVNEEGGYTLDGDYGHYLMFCMIIRELNKLGKIIGIKPYLAKEEEIEVQ